MTDASSSVAARAARLQDACAVVALLALSLGALAGGPTKLPGDDPACALPHPMLALELRSHPGDLACFVADPKTVGAFVRAIHFDYAFIPTYVLLFALVGARIFRRGAWLRLVGGLVALLALAGGLADLGENGAMLSALAQAGGDSRPFALAKWALLFICMLGTAFAYDDETSAFRRGIGRVAGGLGAAAGVVGGLGLLSTQPRLIAGGVSCLIASLASGLLFFATRRLFRAAP